MVARTYLFVPGDRPDMLEKASARGADSLIVDLEDSVAPSAKAQARRVTTEWLDKGEAPANSVWIRVNSGEQGSDDLKALRGNEFAGVMLPKVDTVAEVQEKRNLIDVDRAKRQLIVLIETPRAMRNLDSLAAEPGVYQLMLGEADLGAALGMDPGSSGWDALRVEVVVVSAAVGIEAPIGPIDPDFRSPTRFEADTRHLRSLGFASRAVIHPSQIGPAHAGLAPSAEEIEHARRLLAGHEEAMLRGEGVHLDADGRMVDEAFVRKARRIVDRAPRK